MNNYNDYENEYEEYNKELDEKENRQNPKKTKIKKTKTKKITKYKTKKQKPKTKIVYKDKKSSSGLLTFFLIMIILGLLAVIGYLVYINYYEKEELQNNNITNEQTVEKICEATASKYNISSGLKKCSNNKQFKLTIKNTNLLFDITRTTNNQYIINNIYYKENKINASKIIGVHITDQWELKEKDNIYYLLVQKEDSEDSQILIAIKDGNVLYQGNDAVYNLTSDINYTKYTKLGLEEINTCEYYESNNLLESEMWAKGELVYENGQIVEKQEETITANDVCKK